MTILLASEISLPLLMMVFRVAFIINSDAEKRFMEKGTKWLPWRNIKVDDALQVAFKFLFTRRPSLALGSSF